MIIMLDNFLTLRNTTRDPSRRFFFGFLVSDIIMLSGHSDLRPFDSGGTSLGTKQVTGRWPCCWKIL
jgi:hypothetical protein